MDDEAKIGNPFVIYLATYEFLNIFFFYQD